LPDISKIGKLFVKKVYYCNIIKISSHLKGITTMNDENFTLNVFIAFGFCISVKNLDWQHGFIHLIVKLFSQEILKILVHILMLFVRNCTKV